MENLKTNLQGRFNLFVYHGSKFTSYAIRIATKEQDGTYTDCYINVSFNQASGYKDWKPRNSRYQIEIEESWPKAIKKKDGTTSLVLAIQKCKCTAIIEKEPVKEQVNPNPDLPF